MRKVQLEVSPTSSITSCLYIFSKHMFRLETIQCQWAGSGTTI